MNPYTHATVPCRLLRMQYSMPSLIIIGCARTNIKKHLLEWTSRRASRPQDRGVSSQLGSPAGRSCSATHMTAL